jgi:twinkle protein
MTISVQEYKNYPIYSLTHKPVPKFICEKYGVRTICSEKDGSSSGVLYPYIKRGVTIAYKIRELPKTFKIAGEGKGLPFFGQELFPSGKMIVVTEGEDDALAAATMFAEKGKNYSVVSIPNGATSAITVFKQEFEWVSKFTDVILCFDMDDPGRKAATEVADLLAPVTTVRVMTLPEGYKDASDMLADRNTEGFWNALSKASIYSPVGVVFGNDISIDYVRKPTEIGYEIPYPELQYKLKGLRKRELTVVCAGSGIGKSTWARELSYHLNKVHGLKTANIFIEEDYKKTSQSFIALDNNIPLAKLRTDPGIIPEDKFIESHTNLIANNRTWFFNHFGSINPEMLVNKIRYFALAQGVDFVFLDHLSMVISGTASNDERKDIDMLMTSLASLINETGVGIITVVHLKRKSGQVSYNQGGQVELTDLRGSGALEQLSWNVIALERNQQSTDQADFSTIRLLKNREWGYTGSCDKLFYNKETGRLLPAISEDSDV